MFKFNNSSNILLSQAKLLRKINPFAIYLFSQNKFLDSYHKQRQRLLLSSSSEAWSGYKNMRTQAKQEFGEKYEQILMRQGLTPPVPGLIYIHNILSTQQLQHLKKNSLSLYQQMRKAYQLSSSIHKSYNHNLSSDKSYKLLKIGDQTANQNRLHCQMFVDYGSFGHDLVYFIENKNIPAFVKDILLSQICTKCSKTVQKAQGAQKQLNWRLTFNIYKKGSDNKQQNTAFMWHKDIAVNGIITSITSIMGRGYFQIKDQNNQEINYKIQLIPGSIVILSGEARWKWVHRVLRIPHQQAENDVSRISLVLGCK